MDSTFLKEEYIYLIEATNRLEFVFESYIVTSFSIFTCYTSTGLFKHIDTDTWFNLGAMRNLVFLVCKERGSVSTRVIFITIINTSPQIDRHIVGALTKVILGHQDL